MLVLDPIAQLHLVTIGAVVALFLATFLLLRRTCILPLLDAMDRRAARIEAARARRVEAEARLAESRLRAQGILERARAEAGRITAEARQLRVRAKEERLARASAEADSVLSRGRDELAALRLSEQARLVEELCACVGQVLARLAGPADERMVRFLVNQALAEREAR